MAHDCGVEMISTQFSLYEPDEKEAANILYLRDSAGNDWYEYQERFSDNTLKIAFTNDGVIRSADYDVSKLWPIDMSVAEMDKNAIPDGFDINGTWVFDGQRIVPVPVDYVALAELEKQRLLAEATAVIAPLQDAVDFGDATDEEAEKLTVWKKYRIMVNRVDTSNPVWPATPE